ncbi:hypothetical protein M3Y99_01318600 [Aphelenchoides fujianensis]|nr:hypothetical protein M3Y99_01318600 [Aphelenchoides fujianensis]
MRPRLQASGFWACVLVVGFVSHRANADSNSPRGSTKRMCFHCHSPFACAVGFCYGDYCVKSLVGDKYVSKGCENRSASMYARSLLMDPSGQENIAGCTETPVFGVPNVVCYCNDNGERLRR